MNKLFLILMTVSIAAMGCDSGSEMPVGGSGGDGGAGGMGGEGGTGGTEPKCQTPQAMLRCDKVLNIAHRGGRRIRPEHTHAPTIRRSKTVPTFSSSTYTRRSMACSS